MDSSQLVIPARFNGPPRSGNGGYVAGALAGRIAPATGATVTVSLRRPPPLDTPMDLVGEDGSTRLLHDGELVAEASVDDEELEPIPAVPAEEAERASAAYPGHRSHPFPTCFSCGPARDDGLGIFPGEVPPAGDGRRRVAATWTPDESLVDDLAAVAWAALDCVSGWASGIEDRPAVLGRMTARLHSLPRIGEKHVVLGRCHEVGERKTRTASTLVEADGAVVGTAEQVWVHVDPEAFSALR